MRQSALSGTHQDVLQRRLRANPLFEFLPFSALSKTQVEVLKSLIPDIGGEGVLQPRQGSPYSIKSLPPEITQLWCFLKSPQLLPAWARARFGQRCAEVVTRLVWDGILEAEAAGEFVSGARAYELFCLSQTRGEPETSRLARLARLSRDALIYAQALPPLETLALSARLYFFHRIPVSPEWLRRFPTSAVVAEHLGIEPDGVIRGSSRHCWQPVDLPPSGDGWFMWSRPADNGESRHSQYKLYLSVGGPQLCDILRHALLLATELPCSGFKVGKDVYGLLRPDKLVLYFHEFEDLQRAGNRYLRELRGVPVQGVPFTAELAGDGLLSWGMDPPSHEQARNYGGESWRLWVTNRLAAALALANAADLEKVQPWQFAMARLALDGVDPETWTLRETPWTQGATEIVAPQCPSQIS